MSWLSWLLEQGIQEVAPSLSKGTTSDENMEYIDCMGYSRSALSSVGWAVWDADVVVERYTLWMRSEEGSSR